MPLTQQQASAEIAKKIADAQRLITECETIADESGVDFHWSGPSYGMGGSYGPKKQPDDVADGDWNESSTGWMASSASC